jgi:hypothetical protein
MAIAIDATRAARRRRAAEVPGVTNKQAGSEEGFHVTRFIGALPGNLAHIDDGEGQDRSLPQAFLVEQPANGVVAPHFHETDQFQVVVAGAAHLGKNEAQPLSLHFAGAHTPYGPIRAHGEGVHYFTLRPRWDPGARPMPKSRDLLRKGQQRHHLPDRIAVPAAGDLAGAGIEETAVIAPMPDGLAATAFRIGPGLEAALALPGDGDQFVLVYAGGADCAGTRLGVNGCLFRYAGEQSVTAIAGPNGAAMLVMQFPAQAA